MYQKRQKMVMFLFLCHLDSLQIFLEIQYVYCAHYTYQELHLICVLEIIIVQMLMLNQ